VGSPSTVPRSLPCAPGATHAPGRHAGTFVRVRAPPAARPSNRGVPMIAEIQVAPRPADPTAVPYPHVDAAIAVIKASGLVSEVGAMGTTLEGTPDEIWSVLRAAHEAVLADGAA